MNLADYFTVILTLLGLFFFTAGTLGLLRFPDVFSRLHALTKADNLGLGLVAIGLLPQAMSVFDGFQLVLSWVLVMISGAVSSYLVANYAMANLAQPIKAEIKKSKGDVNER